MSARDFLCWLESESGKLWVKIALRDHVRLIAFEDLLRCVARIVHCENVKYAGHPRFADGTRKPSDMVREFMNACVDAGDLFRDRPDIQDEDIEKELRVFWEERCVPIFKMPARTLRKDRP